MPEVEICVLCKKTIKPDDLWVEVPPAAPESGELFKPQYTQHAHADCFDKLAGIEQSAHA